MLQIAEENFKLKDYYERRTNALKFYPILMKSYIDKAMSNYVRAIILNYHNHYSSFQEHEEIFNEMTGGVIYKVKNSDIHMIWSDTSAKEMEKDRMFYDFKEEKLVRVKPAFICSLETPLLCRALRYGIALKLEDLFTEYIKNIEICISILGRSSKKDNFDDEFFSFNNDDDKLDSSISTICSAVDEDKAISSSQKYHEKRIKKLSELNLESIATKEKAFEELKSLNSLYQATVSDVIATENITSETKKLKLKSSFISKLKDTDELIKNMNKYLLFSCENKRFFNVSF